MSRLQRALAQAADRVDVVLGAKLRITAAAETSRKPDTEVDNLAAGIHVTLLSRGPVSQARRGGGRVLRFLMAGAIVAQPSADEVHEQVKRVLALVGDIPDRSERRRLASRAFSFAQHAEALQRAVDEGQEANTNVDPHLKIVAETNILKFMDALYIETDKNLRETYREMALREERWYGIRQERLYLLMRLLRDCDDRMLRLNGRIEDQRASGLATDDVYRLMDTLLDTQRLLLESFCDELSADT